MIRLVMLLIFIACFSCNQQKVLEVNRMKLILWDLACADDWYGNAVFTDSMLKIKKENFKLYEEIFLANKTTKESFYYSYKYYQSHPDMYKILLDSTINYANERRNKFLNSPSKMVPVSSLPVQ